MNERNEQNKVSIEGLPTGVAGLDSVVGDGIPEYSLNVIGQNPWVQTTPGVRSTQGLGRGVPPQDTEDKKHNVNVKALTIETNGGVRSSPQLPPVSGQELDYLAQTIADACADHKPVSLRTFRRIASRFGRDGVFELLGLVNEASRDGVIATNKGRYLVGVAKRVAAERGINLNLGGRAPAY